MQFGPIASVLGRYCLAIFLLLCVLGLCFDDLSPSETDAGLVPTAVVSRSPELDEQLARLDQAWRTEIAESGLQTAGEVDWLTHCRRLSLALVGNSLSLEEIRSLQSIDDASRRVEVHLQSLLQDSRFHHYWAERWTRRLVGNDEGEFITFRRRRFRQYLADFFARDDSYHHLIQDLVTAKGFWTSSPEVNFYSATFDSNESSPDPIRLAARSSRVFLGLRIDCLQCHDDFVGNVSLRDDDGVRGGLQSDFHQFASFFTSAKNQGLQGLLDGQPEYQTKYLGDDEATDVVPAVPYGQDLLGDQDDPRERLAAWLIHPENRQAARAAVSHVWTLMFGRAKGGPDAEMDNLPLDIQPGPVMNVLIDAFIDNQGDLRELIRLIALSGPMRVDSRADFEITARHEAVHAAFPLVRLRGEQIAASMNQAARIKTIDQESLIVTRLMAGNSGSEFVGRFGDAGEEELCPADVTIGQRLLVMNGELQRSVVGDNPLLSAASHAAIFAADDPQVVETLFLSSLNRWPSDRERQYFTTQLAEGERRRDVVEDLMWSLINSSEFSWNH